MKNMYGSQGGEKVAESSRKMIERGMMKEFEFEE
jgi:hypothetical protein